MTCSHCAQPAILTDANGLCPRCYYRRECEAICAAAETEVDRVLSEPASSPAEPAWTW